MWSPSSRYPGPWTCPFIKLHLYLTSGEFVCEDNGYVEECVDQFDQYLEEGVITPDLDLGDNGVGGRDYEYILVWNGIVLKDGRRFSDIVRDHGMSETEPNHITVVKHECGTSVASENEAT